LISWNEGEVLRLPVATCRLAINVPPVTLNKGKYFVSFFLCHHSFQGQHQLVDAVSFTVGTSHAGHMYADAKLTVPPIWSWARVDAKRPIDR
jgi:hypothetical protein